MEYQEELNLRNVNNPRTAEAQAYSSKARTSLAVADTLSKWGDFGLKRYENTMIDNAKEEAGNVEPSTLAPDKKSPTSVVGRVYNEIVIRGHYAAVRNKYTDDFVLLAQK
jgi:hypothetical protein